MTWEKSEGTSRHRIAPRSSIPTRQRARLRQILCVGHRLLNTIAPQLTYLYFSVHNVSKFTFMIVLSYLFSDYLFASTKQSTSGKSKWANQDNSVVNKPSGHMDNLVSRAHELIGTPYKWGGASVSKGFDCSGLIVYLFRSEAGINIPRTTASMLSSPAKTIYRNQLKSGDAVFFKHNGANRMRHVGIYIGGGRFIHSPRTGKSIRIDSLNNSYWNKSYYTAKRFH